MRFRRLTGPPRSDRVSGRGRSRGSALRNEWADRPDGCAGSRRIGAQDRPSGSDGRSIAFRERNKAGFARMPAGFGGAGKHRMIKRNCRRCRGLRPRPDSMIGRKQHGQRLLFFQTVYGPSAPFGDEGGHRRRGTGRVVRCRRAGCPHTGCGNRHGTSRADGGPAQSDLPDRCRRDRPVELPRRGAIA